MLVSGNTSESSQPSHKTNTKSQFWVITGLVTFIGYRILVPFGREYFKSSEQITRQEAGRQVDIKDWKDRLINKGNPGTSRRKLHPLDRKKKDSGYEKKYQAHIKSRIDRIIKGQTDVINLSDFKQFYRR